MIASERAGAHKRPIRASGPARNLAHFEPKRSRSQRGPGRAAPMLSGGMPLFEELKAYVGFGAADEERLHRLRPHVTPHATAISDRFYDVILRFPDATAVFADMAQVNRLKRTLVKWIDELLSGPYDRDYYMQRRRIGSVHVKVGLASHYMFTAMNRLMEDIHRIAASTFPAEASAFAESLRKITDIELAIMLGTYIDAREQGKLDSLRDLLVAHLRTTVVLVDKERRVQTATNTDPPLFQSGVINGKTLAEAAPELHAAAHLEELIARAIAARQETVLPRVEVVVDDRTLVVRVAVVPLLHPSVDALIQVEDLTEAFAAEERAKQEQHLKKLGMMAASVAHEIRNPLAGISGTVQFIASSLPSDDVRVEALTEVRDQIARLGSLVGDLLNFSRPITADARPVDLAHVAGAAIQQASASEGYVASVNGEGVALGDAALLSQVLLNLVQNAWQAGAKTVVVDVAPGRVFVCDDGPGIKPENRARIFEPFFTTKVRGTGLGLSVARKMIEAMNGSIALAASPLGGAGFDVRLPPADIAR
jgi:signal transduction histidine kinase